MLSTLSFVLGGLGTILASLNIIESWRDKRRKGTVDERRQDVEGLSTLVEKLEGDNESLRKAQADDRKLIEAQGRKIIELTDEVAVLTRQARIDADKIDRLSLALEIGERKR